MNILGISCFYHDSAAALVRDGEILAAGQEERFSRKKHDFRFPSKTIAWIFKEYNLSPKDIDYVVFYEKPFLKFERILEASLSFAPSGISQFIQAMPLWLKQKLWIPEIIKKELNYNGKLLFAGHHEAHAASAFYPSPFKEAVFLTMDGVGEWETVSFGVGRGNDLELEYYLRFPHSLGLLYSAFTYYTGFKVNSGEYKLMGLAPYGEPKYTDLILNELLDLKEDGSFKLNMKYFAYCNSLRMTNRRFYKLFDGPPRKPETRITQKYMDVAASIQKVTEEIMLRMSRHARKVTGQDNLCLAGGVALNCVGNGRILREGGFKNIWIQPASGDAGAALGAALFIWYKYLGNKRANDEKKDSQQASLLGPHYSDERIESFLKDNSVAYRKYSKDDLAAAVADLIAAGNVVGWFQGKMEFGPRALGTRSILADARNPKMQSKMNLKIKYRESFRPFAPSVMEEKASECFELNCPSPYMLLAAPVKKDKRIPAVTHVDYSARIQTVNKDENPLFYELLNEFYKKTGCPVVINTSFNVRGEPLVCTLQDALRCFMRTGMDYLVIGHFLLDKKEQKPAPEDSGWQKEFELD